MKRYLLSLALMLSISFASSAQVPADVRADPGYLDLGMIESWFNQEANIEVNVQGALLNLVRSASRHEDEELADMLGKLKGVYVRGYKIDPAAVENIASRTGKLAQSLSADGWETVVRMRDEEERVDVFLRSNQNRIAGLVVMVVGEDETIFVNIVGEIDPDDIGRIGGRVNVPDIPGMGDASSR